MTKAIQTLKEVVNKLNDPILIVQGGLEKGYVIIWNEDKQDGEMFAIKHYKDDVAIQRLILKSTRDLNWVLIEVGVIPTIDSNIKEIVDEFQPKFNLMCKGCIGWDEEAKRRGIQ